jgi:hypothetical protein
MKNNFTLFFIAAQAGFWRVIALQGFKNGFFHAMLPWHNWSSSIIF